MKKVMVVDNGQFVELAVRLGRDFDVYYCTPWQAEFPTVNIHYIGYGLEEITVVKSMFSIPVEEIDFYVFPDLYHPEEQAHLVAMGKDVWGAREGEALELDRKGAKKLLKRLKLPVGEYTEVKGMDALRDFLKANKEQYVKLPFWRGVWESMFAADYKAAEPKLDLSAHRLGPIQHLLKWICEEPLPDRIEAGIDSYCVDGAWPGLTLAGIEEKDKFYIGVMKKMADFPEPLSRVNEALSPTMKEYGYRNFFSTECRIGKDHEPYLIDATCRCPSPPGELMQELFTNFSEIIEKGASGKCIDPEPAAKFGVQARIVSGFAKRNFCPVDFPEAIRKNVKLVNCCKIKGRYYVIPQDGELDQIGNLVAWGSTREKAQAQLQDMAKEISGPDVVVMSDYFDAADAEIEKAKEMGLDLM